jgi:hypothetical protein
MSPVDLQSHLSEEISPTPSICPTIKLIYLVSALSQVYSNFRGNKGEESESLALLLSCLCLFIADIVQHSTCARTGLCPDSQPHAAWMAHPSAANRAGNVQHYTRLCDCLSCEDRILELWCTPLFELLDSSKRCTFAGLKSAALQSVALHAVNRV